MSAQVLPQRFLGVCYYPEQWPESIWPHDCARMKALGIAVVRIGEFAWSRIEPLPGQYDWGWLDRIMALLHDAGLQVVLGTPTATPPAWLVEAHPQILAVDAAGRVREFGSRRHYCFSSPVYREHCARIVTQLATRYGDHPALYGWQLDNEYGCHDTTLSYSAAARLAFQDWLRLRYDDAIAALNRAWGTVFWSQEYQSFGQIGLPNLTVTEANPAHRLDFQRFASSEVASFNRLQCDILRAHSPGKPLTHNFMGLITDFDHYALGEQLDFVSWDSYPQGFTLDRMRLTSAQQAYYLDTGHPDIAAFHHDLYRAVGRGRWWVMEQQPGPVNWAPYNPIPHAGMVRLWSWEAFAHGAECVSYFRWRQVPHGQEQMHAGLLRPDDVPAAAWPEVAQVVHELALLEQVVAGEWAGDVQAQAGAGPGAQATAPAGALAPRTAAIALVFDYEADWMLKIQPQGAGASAVHTALAWYGAARSLGLDLDIVPPGAPLHGYEVVLVPCQPVISDAFLQALEASPASILFGPRCGSKTAQLAIPPNLAPGPLQSRLPFKVARVASLPPFCELQFSWQGQTFTASDWREELDGEVQHGCVQQHGNWTYLSMNVAPKFVSAWLRALACTRMAQALPEGARWRTRGNLHFAMHYGVEPWQPVVPAGARQLFGPAVLQRADCACWQITSG